VSAEPPALRASDAERERTVGLLRSHALEGRLTLEEFAERIDTAYASRTREELDRVTADLPVDPAVPAQRRGRRAKHLTGVLFGSTERKGRWRVPARSLLIVGFGDADIDLRHAQIEGDAVTITAFVAFGNADFYVPEAVEVDVGGLAVFGHRGEHGEDVLPLPHAPLIRIRVFSMFGTSDVWRIPRGATGSYRELVKSVRQARKLRAG
jgi:Domain of unknown function (DUF1707)